MIHRIDQQLTKLKNKNGSKKEGSEDDEEVAAMPEEKETTDDAAETATPDEKMTDDYGLDGLTDSVKSSRHGHFMDIDADEYAVNRH